MMASEELVQLISSWPPDDDLDDEGEVENRVDGSDSEDDSSVEHEPVYADEAEDDEDAVWKKRPSPVSKMPKPNFEEPIAQVALAAWLRRSYDTIIKKLPPEFSCINSSKSKIYFLTTTEPGIEFLKKKISELESRIDLLDCADYHYVLATYYDLAGSCSRALQAAEKSLKFCYSDIPKVSQSKLKSYLNSVCSINTEDKEKLWFYCKLKAEKELRSKYVGGPESAKSEARTLEVDKVRRDDLSVMKFLGYYCYLRKAVVITDNPSPTTVPWTLDHIKSVCGHKKVKVKAKTLHSADWAGLDTVAEKTVAQFIDDNVGGHYLFDWSLPINSPELNQEFTLPEYFQDNKLTKTSESSLYHNSWPSLFIGPRGTRSGLHIDAFGSHFWMYLVSGRKRWTFYPADSAGKLGPAFLNSMDPVFRPTTEALAATPCYTIVLEPGQLLFVPAGSPHEVENLEDSIAVSGNFVNDSNLEDFLAHLKVNGLLDPRSVDLLQEMVDLCLI